MYAAESSSWGKVVFESAARIAVAPSCGAGTDAREPLNCIIISQTFAL